MHISHFEPERARSQEMIKRENVYLQRLQRKKKTELNIKSESHSPAWLGVAGLVLGGNTVPSLESKPRPQAPRRWTRSATLADFLSELWHRQHASPPRRSHRTLGARWQAQLVVPEWLQERCPSLPSTRRSLEQVQFADWLWRSIRTWRGR